MKKFKFNLIDFIIVLCIVCAGVLAAFVLGNLKGTSGGGEAETETLKYSVEFTKKDKIVLDEFLAAKERGDSCFVSEKEKAPAVISDVIYTPAKEQTTNLRTGETNWEGIPELYDVTVVLESPGTQNNKDVIAGGSAVLKVGEEISVKGKGYAGYGFITSLDIVE